MRRAVIVDAIRSPLGKGKPGGALSDVHPVELLAQLLTGLIDRNGVDPGAIDDVMIGNVTQAGEQGGTPARQAVLAAGFPTHVPGVTVERKCGSGLQAIEFAAQSIAAGVNDLVIAGGVESMSRVPMGSNRMGADVYGPSVIDRFGGPGEPGRRRRTRGRQVGHVPGATRRVLPGLQRTSRVRAGAGMVRRRDPSD